MKAVIKDNEIVKLLQDWETRLELPGLWVSPVEAGWEDHGYKIVAVINFEVPEGKVRVGPPSYTIANDVVVETYNTEDIPPPPPEPTRQVEKAVIMSRITDDQLEQAMSLMTIRQQERWRMPGYPALNIDDPELLQLLQAIGADPEVVLAP